MAFDRYMIQVGAGAHPKLSGLTMAERYVFFNGVLSLAARAHPRGSLQIGGRPVSWKDVARECAGRGQVSITALAKLRQVGVIERSDDGVEWVHDFDDYNPAPRSDATNADRQRAWRQRQKAARNVTKPPPVTLRNAGEVKKLKEEPPLTPPTRNGRDPRPRGRRGTAPGIERGLGSIETPESREADRRLLEQFPGIEAWRVHNAAHALNTLNGTAPSIDEIRDYLHDQP